MSKPKSILNRKQINITIHRLCNQLMENHNNFSNTVIIGLQPRGVLLADRLRQCLNEIHPEFQVELASLDITFYRDDFRRRKDPLVPSSTQLNVSLEDKKVILVDDVLYTGRTVRAALDAMLDFGRPSSVELLVFIDRRLSRHVPIHPDYVGHTVDVVAEERVTVEWGDNERVILEA